MIGSNSGYIMVSKQAVKGTAVIPSIAIPFQSDNFSTNQTINEFKDSRNYVVSHIKNMHVEKFGFDCYARPNYTTKLLAYFMGHDTVTGAGDPYTHTIISEDRGWMTVERKLYASKVQRLTDCKIESITISGQAGKPIKIAVEGMGLTVNIRATELTPSYESRNTFMFYDGSGRFKFATTADNMIKSFSIKLKKDSGGGLKDSTFNILDLPDLNFSVECSMDLYTTNFIRWQNINYYGGTTASESIYKAAAEIDLKYLEIATTREIKITIPQLAWKSISGIKLDPKGQTWVESVAGVAEKLSTTELVTITCMNNITTTLI